MKTASGCRSTNGCTPKYPEGFDPAAKMEARPMKPMPTYSNDEDLRKSLRLIIKRTSEFKGTPLALRLAKYMTGGGNTCSDSSHSCLVRPGTVIVVAKSPCVKQRGGGQNL